MTAPIPRWRNRIRPGRKQLAPDRSPLPRRQTIPMNPAPGPAVRRRPSAARRALPGTCGGYWISFIWIGWTPGDLLLLGLLYFLFREKADEELLVALGLLLIL